MNLSDFAENISDDFGSTFAIIDENTLANALHIRNDLEIVSGIIRKYIPDAIVSFRNTGSNIYLIKLINGESCLTSTCVPITTVN